MYRPWWFPEFSPKDQKIFDAILDIAREVFEQYNYKHIWTPAVEAVDVLKKWWDVIEQQVFGLFGLAQGVEDVKEYALHFDLTVPFARYVLDHRNELTFPFSRYQMQPVWRGERTKRGRFKEFWQMDIDTIWPSETTVWVWYDIQSIAVMDQVMKKVCTRFSINMPFVAKVSHVWVTRKYLASLDLSDEQISWVVKILDNYFKKTPDVSQEELFALIGEEKALQILYVINTKDYTKLANVVWYNDLEKILNGLKTLWVSYEYDICIVRWHNYYSGMVVEWMNQDDIEFGSLAWWWRYDNLTTFIDKKQSFSGVGTSLGRFVYMMIELVSERDVASTDESYLFIHFNDTYDETITLYRQFLLAWKTCEMYPSAAKLGKQFEYADRAGISHCVVYGAWEKEHWSMTVKNMKTWESEQWWFDAAFGVIPVCEMTEGDGDVVKKVLMIQHTNGHRWFPKWHADEGETPLLTAIRECKEEVGIMDVSIHEDKKIIDTYIISWKDSYHHTTGVYMLKTVTYFVWYTKNTTVILQGDEVVNYLWATLDEATRLATFPQMKEVIRKLWEMI